MLIFAQEPSWDFPAPWAVVTPVFSFLLLWRGAREGGRAPLGSAPGCHLIYFYRNEMFLSEARLARNGVSVTPEAPAALGSARSSSWVWGRATPPGEAAQSACSLIRPFIHSAIHSFIIPPTKIYRVSGSVREAGPRRSAAWSRPVLTSV